MNGFRVEHYKGQAIEMVHLNHFRCPMLGLYGYSTVSSLKRAISQKLKANNRIGEAKQ